MNSYRFLPLRAFSLVCLMVLGPWVGSGPVAARAGETAAPTETSAPGSAQERLQVASQAMAQMHQAVTRLQQCLDPIRSTCTRFHSERWPERIRAQEQEKEHLRAQAEQLRNTIAAAEALLRDLPAGDSNVPADLARTRARHQWLRDEVAKYPDPCDTRGNPRFVTSSDHMTPTAFVLCGDRVAPLDDQYFRITVVRYQGRRYVVIDKKQEGQLLADALDSGGGLAAGVSQIDPQKQYVTLLVCPDGVGSFDRVVQKIKDNKGKAHGGNILCTWTPADKLPWILDMEKLGQPGRGVRRF